MGSFKAADVRAQVMVLQKTESWQLTEIPAGDVSPICNCLQLDLVVGALERIRSNWGA